MNKTRSETTHILVVDDDQHIRSLLKILIVSEGYICSVAENATEALSILKKRSVSLLLTDIKMPGVSGIELTKIVKEKYGTDIIVMTGYVEDYNYAKIIEEGATDFLKKPFSNKELLLRIKRVINEQAVREERDHAEQDLKKSFKNIKKAFYGIVNTMAATVEIRDPYTAFHQRRVADLSLAIAKEMGLSKNSVTGIYLAGMVHDIGKLSIPAEILSKPARLTDIEFSLIKNHPKVGYDILKRIEFPWRIADFVYQHHERLDGSGYPQGLSDKNILLETKILSIADVVETMASHRPYRPGFGIDVALGEISKNKGLLYDPEAVDICIKLFREKKYSFTIYSTS